MSVYQYQRLWTIFSLLKLNLYLNPFQVICHQSNLHVLGTNSKAMLLLIFYLGRGGLGFIERYEPYFLVLLGLNTVSHGPFCVSRDSL